MQGYVYVNSNGVVNTLGMFAPIIISDGIKLTTYSWDTITSMSNTELATLGIYPVNVSITPPDGQQQVGIKYSFANGVVSEEGIFAPINIGNSSSSSTSINIGNSSSSSTSINIGNSSSSSTSINIGNSSSSSTSI